MKTKMIQSGRDCMIECESIGINNEKATVITDERITVSVLGNLDYFLRVMQLNGTKHLVFIKKYQMERLFKLSLKLSGVKIISHMEEAIVMELEFTPYIQFIQYEY